MLVAAGLAALAPITAPARPLCAQPAERAHSDPAWEQLAAADRLYFDLRPAEALAAYQGILGARPDDYETLWRAARSALAVGWLEPNEPVSIEWYEQAAEYASNAVRAAGHRPEGHFWLAASLGRRAQLTRNVRTAARLANEVYREANIVLGMDPRHAGAHHVLGQLHYEILTTPWVLRQLGLGLLGGGVHFEPSWTEAEQRLKRATVLEGSAILYRLELARLYVRTQRSELAIRELETALALPLLHPPDPLFKREAQALLESIR